jgi:PAS domain S-box-containing protein
MHQQISPATEVKRLQRCMNDLASILALPDIWGVGEPSRMLDVLFDTLWEILDLEFLYARIRFNPQESPIHALRSGRNERGDDNREQMRQVLASLQGLSDPTPNQVIEHLGAQELPSFSIRLGIEGEFGLIVAGSQTLGFPGQTESLVLSVAANQAAIWLQQSLRLRDQEPVAKELDRRVVERTKELAEANEALQIKVGLLQHIPAGAWTLEPDGTPDFLNEFWLHYTGRTLAFVRSHPDSWTSTVHPDDREIASEALRRGVSTGQGFAMEARFLRAEDATYRWHLSRAVALRDAEGHVFKFVGTSIDIDDRKRGEEALRMSEGSLQRVIDTIPTFTWSMLPDGSNEFLSSQWHDYTGFSYEMSRGWGWQAAFHPEDLAPLMERWGVLLVSGEPGEVEARLRDRDGIYRWFLIRVAPFRDEKSTIVRWYGTSTEINDRKVAEEALRASESNLRQIVDSIPALVCTMDALGEIQQLNRPLLEYFGRTPDELRDWKLTDAVHPDDLSDVVKAFTYSVSTGTPYSSEHRCRRADGVYRWFQVRGLAVHEANGKISGWYVLFTDIEDRKLAEDALRANESNLIQIINTIPMLAWSTRPDGFVEFLNQRWLNFTGLSAEQAGGWGWAQVIHPDDAARLVEYWQAALESGSKVDVEARMRRFDGEYRWFLFRADAMRDVSGAIIKWYGTNTDIHVRKQTEEALRIRELNLREITETIPEMLWSASPDGAIEYCNGRFLDYTGLSLEQTLIDGWMKALHPDDVEPTVAIWQSCVKSGSPYRVEVRTFHAADHTYRWCVTRALPLIDQRGRIVKWHGTVVDMHDWKQAQEQLRDTQAELTRMLRVMTIGQLTGSIAHEVSQPLSGIITNATTCLRMLKSEPPDIEGARETARRVIRDGNRASEVIDRLRSLFKNRQRAVEPVDLNEATREVFALLSGELQKNNVILKHEFDDLLPIVDCDRVQIQQVILNLLRNASDAMSDVEDRPRQLVVRTDQKGDHVRLSVQDSGIGFSLEVADRMFDPFYTTKHDGMGIGLSICRSILEAHHGRLWAVPNDGSGSIFSFSIPAKYQFEDIQQPTNTKVQ